MYPFDRELVTMIVLAKARYPDAAIDVALTLFDSDRRVAGLGALHEKRRTKRREGVARWKYEDWESRRVFYVMRMRRPARQEYVPQKLPIRALIGVPAMEALVCKTRTVPPVDVDLRMPIDLRDLIEQSGRDETARLLRRMRRTYRDQVKAAHA